MATAPVEANTNLSPEEEAQKLLLFLLPGLAKPPVPVDKIAELLEIKLVISPLQPGVSGALIREGGQSFIVVNSGHHRNRQRFTIAHEIAHHRLEHAMDDHVDREFTVIMRDENSSSAENALEIAANQFAAALLMPRSLVMRDFTRLGGFLDDAVPRLALKYQVSELALQLRLRNLGLLQPF
ncbi:MAG: ImmA/IrrE family metallo-endopeptidase [Terracidiphilus sp.]